MKSKLKTVHTYLKNFQSNSIFIKNFILITLVILLSFSAISTIFYINSHNNLEEQMAVVANGNVLTVKNSVDSIIHTAEQLAIQTILNQNVQTFSMHSNLSGSSTNELYQNLKNYISEFTNIYPYINSIYIYSESRKLLVSNFEITPFSEHSDNNWLQYYEKSDINKSTLVTRKKNDRYPHFISIIRCISLDDKTKAGCVVVNLDSEQLNEILSKTENVNPCSTIIYNENNEIILCENIKQAGNLVNNYLDADSYDSLSKNVFGSTKLSDKEYFFSKSASDYYNFTYLTLVPKTYFNNMLSSLNFVFIIYILLLPIGLIISGLITAHTYAPIHQIINLLLPEQKSDDENGTENEITFITNTIRNMLDKNFQLTEELRYRLLLLNQAQTYALQTQINPHFLNNTLESINWTAINELGEKNKISAMIKSLSALLDISLDNTHYLIPIKEELQHSNIYTYIMRLNYGSDLNFVWHIEDGITSHKIVKLSLQPLLENAITHGISAHYGKGEIVIDAKFSEGGILITVSDNGIGMDEKKLAELRQELNSNVLHGKRIGLKNVNQRIKLLFGETYGLSITSQKNVGTKVSIFIPKT